MWLLHFLPEAIFSFLVYTLLVLGVVGVILSFFVLNKILSKVPGLAKYYRLAQLGSVLALTLGVYLWGGYSMEMAYRERVAELQKELETAKAESKKVNTVIETKVVTKTKVIKEKGETIIQQVDRIIPGPAPAASGGTAPVANNANMCVNLPQEAIDVHNEAARLNKAVEELRKGAGK